MGTTMISEDEIEAARSPKGGWTKETLAGWGVPWPPPKGWKLELTGGKSDPPIVGFLTGMICYRRFGDRHVRVGERSEARRLALEVLAMIDADPPSQRLFS